MFDVYFHIKQRLGWKWDRKLFFARIYFHCWEIVSKKKLEIAKIRPHLLYQFQKLYTRWALFFFVESRKKGDWPPLPPVYRVLQRVRQFLPHKYCIQLVIVGFYQGALKDFEHELLLLVCFIFWPESVITKPRCLSWSNVDKWLKLSSHSAPLLMPHSPK